MENVLLFIYGASLASFAICTADRRQNGRSLLVARSCCDTCFHQLTWWQLIPVGGFLLQKGRCHFCRTPIAPLSCKLEIVYGCLFVVLGQHFYRADLLLLSFLHIWLLLLAYEDHHTMQVSSSLLYYGALLLVLFSYDRVKISIHYEGLFLLLLTLLFFSFELFGQLGRADTICLVVCGLLFGSQFVCWTLLFAGIFFILQNLQAKPQQPHPFLPAITCGMICANLLLIF